MRDSQMKKVGIIIFGILLNVGTTLSKPQTEGQQGPCVGMDCLHGVLMHNDEQQGEDHVTEDQYLRFKGTLDTGAEQAGPQDGETFMHETLMHGGEGHGEHKNQALPEVVAQAGPMDLNDVIHEGMHGGEGIPHNHDAESTDADHSINARKGPLDAEQMMHGVLMHSDENHVHDDDGETDVIEEVNAVPGTLDAEGLMHDLLMHGGAKHTEIEDHGDKISVDEFNLIGPDGSTLHGILMHNDGAVGHDHSEEDANAEHEVFSDMSKIREIVQDEDLLKMIDLEAILLKDMKEYSDWLESGQQNTPNGETIATVSDSILADIDLMKKRYLDLADDIIEEEFGGETPSNKEIPFTADDANMVLEDHVHNGDDEGTTHDLELLGSTEPLNARHKVQLELEKQRK